MSRYLVTGAAGFIGYHTSRRLLNEGHEVLGYDCINDYYDVNLKYARLKHIEEHPNFRLVKADLEDQAAVDQAFQDFQPEYVIHLAAQAGVRYSLTKPRVYLKSNMDGTLNILEACRHFGCKHLTYASSSSVYGSNKQLPFSVEQSVDHPVSLYAATKKANELMAHTYSHLYDIPTTGLRFFTVYGPWGRPDMAMFLFTKAILAGEPINVFNHGKMQRDFTYIDDIVEGVLRTARNIPTATDPETLTGDPTPARSHAPYRVYNIGNNQPVELMHMIEVLEDCLGQKAEKNLMPIQPGDVPATYADVDALIHDVGFQPATPIDVGIRNFVNWYKEYFGLV